MKKTLITFLFTILVLTGCGEPELPKQYEKTNGEVVGKNIVGGRFGNSYYINISYPVKGEYPAKGGKFIIDDSTVNKDIYDSINIKDKVTVYVNKNGIGEIVR